MADSHTPDKRTPADRLMRAMGISANRRAELAQVHPADILAAWSKYSTDATIRDPAALAAKKLAEGMTPPALTAGDIIRAIERGYVATLNGRTIDRAAKLTHNELGLYVNGKMAIPAGELRDALAVPPIPDTPPWGAADASAAPATPEATDRPKAASEATNAPEGKPSPAPGNVHELAQRLGDAMAAPRERLRTAYDLRRELSATEPPPRQRRTVKPAEPAKPLSAEELEARREAVRKQAADLKEAS